MTNNDQIIDFYNFSIDSHAEETASSGEECTNQLVDRLNEDDIEKCASQKGTHKGKNLNDKKQSSFKTQRKKPIATIKTESN